MWATAPEAQVQEEAMTVFVAGASQCARLRTD
jgi:hypothetical protein